MVLEILRLTKLWTIGRTMIKYILGSLAIGMFLGYAFMSGRLKFHSELNQKYQEANRKLNQQVQELEYHFGICRKLYRVGCNAN